MTEDARRPTGVKHFLTSTGSGYLVRLVAIGIGVAVLPIGIGAYGAAGYGVWIAASSLAHYASNGALGMPLAVLTAISSTEGRLDAGRIAAQGLRVVALGSLALAAVGGGLWLAFPSWPATLFGAPGTTRDVVVAVAVLLAGTIVLQPLQVYATVLAGRHRIVARDVYSALAAIGRFVALLMAAGLSESLTTLAVLAIASDALVTVVRAVHVTVRERVPVHRFLLDRSTAKPGLVASGLRFLVLQLEVTVIRNTDNLVISGILGPAAVSVYAAPFRLITVASGLVEAVQGPLWPAYGAARLRGDWDWIRTAHRRVIALGLVLGGALWIGFVGFAAPVIALWLGPDFPVDPWVVMVLGAYAFIATWVNANAILLNALDATQSQVFSGGAEAAVNLTSSVLLAPLFGLAGVAGGTLLGASSVSSWLLPLDVRKRTDGRVSPMLRDLVTVASYTAPLALAAHLSATAAGNATRYGVPVIALAIHLAAGSWCFRDELRLLRQMRTST